MRNKSKLIDLDEILKEKQKDPEFKRLFEKRYAFNLQKQKEKK